MAIRLTDSPIRAKRDRKLGARLVNDLPAPDRGSKIYHDGSPEGFALRVTARGVRSFIMRYTVRTNGIRRLKTIGRHGPDNWTVKAARKEALRLRNLINQGEDPMGDLRHSYASILVSAGLSLPVIGALLGHAQPRTTARYAHLFDDPLREATERLGAIVEAARKLAENPPPRTEPDRSRELVACLSAKYRLRKIIEENRRGRSGD